MAVGPDGTVLTGIVFYESDGDLDNPLRQDYQQATPVIYRWPGPDGFRLDVLRRRLPLLTCPKCPFGKYEDEVGWVGDAA